MRRFLFASIFLVAATPSCFADYLVLRLVDSSIPWESRPCWIAELKSRTAYRGQMMAREPDEAAAYAALLRLQDNGVCHR